VTEEICKADAYARAVEAIVTEVWPEGIVLDRTVFYARGGGQAGDAGWLRTPNGHVRVTDTYRIDGTPVHVCKTRASSERRST